MGGANVPKALTKPITQLKRWKEMDFKSFMVQGVDGKFNFLHAGGLDEGQGSPSMKSVNNEMPVVDTEPIYVVHPPTFAKNLIDSSNASHENDDLTPVGLYEPYDLETGNTSKAIGKRKHIVAPLDVDSDPDIHEFHSTKELRDDTDCHWVVAHVTPLSRKQHLRDISLEQLCDIHDRAYMRQAVLHNVLNSRTHELIYALYKARASCDAIREREIKKDKAYTELENKFNEAL
ncbi:hypothetical protein Tco_0298724 [Tanacetum coccineum]